MDNNSSRKFVVRVNGTPYEVEVEEVSSCPAQSKCIPHPESAISKSDKVSKSPNTVSTATAHNGINVKAPMPGTILNININEGDTVKKGQVLIVLEAMKMENELTAPSDGVISTIFVKNGQKVNLDDILLSIEHEIQASKGGV